VSGDPYVAVAETHTGGVLFVDDLAYKVKKPVALGFLDWTDRAERARAIDNEFTLNRRLAPDVYLGTTTLPRPDSPGEPVLVMRRLPSERRLSALVQRGEDVEGVLRQLAHQLATLHLASPVTPLTTSVASATETRRRWETNHKLLRPSFGRWVDGEVAGEVFERACRYLDGRHALLDERITAGWARDGHGDLLADDVFCLDDGPRILDCLDFDERLRVGDVLADVAFLAMDLERLGRGDLGWRFLELHREMTGDSWPESLAHHYIAYRAQVRTLVSCVRADQDDHSAATQAAELLSMAQRHVTAGQVRLILVGGAPGTGKSTLASALGDRLRAPVLRSDEIRKALAGVPAGTSAAAGVGAGIYTEEWTERTYAEMLVRAGRLLGHGESVILDATWAERRRRAFARAVVERGVAEVVELRCIVPCDVAQARAERRRHEGGDASDAGAAVAAAMAAAFEPWPESIAISTAATPEQAVDAAAAALEESS
jgi:uncharacterized protein